MPRAFVICGLGWGDEGKGGTVDALCRRLPGATVVRFNGGSQAGHNVVTPEGKHHTFSQFGAGMFVPTTRTHLSGYMLINPLNMFNEAEHLEEIGVRDPWGRTSVDPGARIITPYHKALNRLRELARGPDRHGSCGQGIGETVLHSKAYPAYVLRAGTLLDLKTTRVLLAHAKGYCVDQVRDLDLPGTDIVRAELDSILLTDEWELLKAYEAWAKSVTFLHDDRLGDEPALHMCGPLVFEGAQGILLDETHGFHPHTTWSSCTTKNALRILRNLEVDYDVVRLGVTRTYMTRHGEGPLPSEDKRLVQMMDEPHNGYGAWQGGWRCGFLDIPHLQYAIEVTNGLDGLVITHMDKIPNTGLPVVYEYVDNDPDPGVYAVASRVTSEAFLDVVSSNLGTGVYMTSAGPTADDKFYFDKVAAA